MTGRGRGRGRLPVDDPEELDAAFAVYEQKCEELERERSQSSSQSSTSSPYEASSSSSPAETSPVPVVSSQILGMGRGRGRGLTSFPDVDPPMPGLIPGASAASSSLSVPAGGLTYSGSGADGPLSSSLSTDDEISNAFRSLDPNLGLGRGRGKPRQIVIPIPETASSSRTSIGRGRINTEYFQDQPSFQSPLFAVGVENFNVIEKEVVVRRGEKGTPVPMTANFIRLGVEEGRGLFEYHVDFEPILESFRTRRRIIANHEDVLGNVRNFDGAKLYLPFQLSEPKVVLKSPNPNDTEQIITITIRFVKKNRMDECIHFYNVLFRRIMEKLGMLEVNRNYYDYRSRYKLPKHRLEIWPGYVTAVDELEGGLILCCDVSHRVLRTSTMLDVYNDLHYESRGDREKFKQLYHDYAVGQIVLTRYNNKNYRIDDIAWDQNPKCQFQLSNGEYITYIDYYKRQYDITITDYEQPLLIHKPRLKQENGGRRRQIGLVCLIPECSYMTGLSADLTQNRMVMKDVAEFTRVQPEQRRLALTTYVQNIEQNPEAKAILENWGLTIEPAAMELAGRILAPPHIIVNPGTVLTSQIDFGNDMARNPCLQPIFVKEWMIVFPGHDKGSAAKFVQTYKIVCRTIGIEVYSDPKFVPVQGHQSRLVENYAITIKENLMAMKNLQFVVVIVPREIGELYSAIKKLCCKDRPIPSQVILSKTMGNDKQIRSIVGKIALQINCKLGGALWTIRIPLVEKIMFVGMDVYHDPKQRSPSVLALVASLNAEQTKYYSRIVSQRASQEIGDSLRNIFKDSLHAYQMECGGMPDRIIVFRDGVGDGQLDQTKDIEVAQMMSVLQSTYEEKLPMFTFAIVQKRISCRMFARDENMRSLHYTNPAPGTVLDHTVTRRYLFDFFLVSQLVRQGTVSPTHYIVLEDNSNIKPDLIQKFAFATSFLYYNWAGPIRVPAVCQYAHKLAYLVGQYIKDAPSAALSSQLYYL